MVTFTKSKEYDGTPIEGFIYVNGMENIGANLLDSAAYGRAFTIIPLIVGKYMNVNFMSGTTVDKQFILVSELKTKVQQLLHQLQFLKKMYEQVVVADL